MNRFSKRVIFLIAVVLSVLSVLIGSFSKADSAKIIATNSSLPTFAKIVNNNKIGSFSFFIFGDSQSSDGYSAWGKTFKNAHRLNPSATFFVNVGDLVDNRDSLTEWTKWEHACFSVTNRLPALPVTGNHDGISPIRKKIFSLPRTGPSGGNDLAYSYDYGPAHFIALNDVKESDTKALAVQKSWLTKDLAATKKTWKIVFFHRPPYSNKISRNNRYLLKTYKTVFDKYHVTVVFNGHDHVVARTKTVNKGTIYYTVGRSGTKYYKDVRENSLDAFFYNPVKQPNYVQVNVNKSSIKITALNQDNTIIDRFTITK